MKVSVETSDHLVGTERENNKKECKASVKLVWKVVRVKLLISSPSPPKEGKNRSNGKRNVPHRKSPGQLNRKHQR